MRKYLVALAILGVLIMLTAMPLPTGKDNSDVIYAAQTIFGEARGESWPAKLAVGNVILNRKKTKRKYFGRSIKTIVQKPQQFSCWNYRDPNYSKIHNPLKHESVDTWLECYIAAHLVLGGQVKDNTGGAMYYFDDSLLSNPPSWAARLEQSAKHGRLNFFRERKKDIINFHTMI